MFKKLKSIFVIEEEGATTPKAATTAKSAKKGGPAKTTANPKKSEKLATEIVNGSKDAKPEKKLHCKWSEERKHVGSDNHAQKMRSFDKSYNFLILDYYKLQRSLLLYNNYSSFKYLRI